MKYLRTEPKWNLRAHRGSPQKGLWRLGQFCSFARMAVSNLLRMVPPYDSWAELWWIFSTCGFLFGCHSIGGNSLICVCLSYGCFLLRELWFNPGSHHHFLFKTSYLPNLFCYLPSLFSWVALLLLEQGSPTPPAGTGPWPVRNQATQQEVSGGQASKASSASPHRVPSLTLPPNHHPCPPAPIHGKIDFHKTGPWCQKCWGPMF